MHATTEAHPEPTNFTPPKTPEEALARIKEIYRAKRLESEVIMVAAQTKALETLMACMTPIRSTGDSKLDAFYARERNRQRLAAIQTLLHIRTVQREKRLRKAMRAKAKAKAERTAMGGVVRSEADGHVDNGSTAPSPLAGGSGRECDRMRGQPESSDRSESPDHAQTILSMPPDPIPTSSRNNPAARIIAVAGSTTGLASTAYSHRLPTPHPA